jgi:hypothetical protein
MISVNEKCNRKVTWKKCNRKLYYSPYLSMLLFALFSMLFFALHSYIFSLLISLSYFGFLLLLSYVCHVFVHPSLESAVVDTSFNRNPCLHEYIISAVASCLFYFISFHFHIISIISPFINICLFFGVHMLINLEFAITFTYYYITFTFYIFVNVENNINKMSLRIWKLLLLLTL